MYHRALYLAHCYLTFSWQIKRFFILNDVDIASYADDNTSYVIAGDINGVITSLEKASKALFEWFENNLLKSNADKCHLLVSSSDAVNLRVSEYDIKIVNVRNC